MSRLSERLQLVMDEIKISARALESRAGLPTMTVRGIMDNAHPRTERFEKLLRAIPSLEHRCELLTAYILDDCPESHRPSVEAICQQHLLTWHQQHSAPESSHVAEAATGYRARPSTATQARAVLDNMRAAVDAGDSALSEWLATTGPLLTPSHLPPPPTTRCPDSTTKRRHGRNWPAPD